MTMDECDTIRNLFHDTPKLIRIEPTRFNVPTFVLWDPGGTLGALFAVEIFLQIKVAKFHINKVVRRVPKLTITVNLDNILVGTATQLFYCS